MLCRICGKISIGHEHCIFCGTPVANRGTAYSYVRKKTETSVKSEASTYVQKSILRNDDDRIERNNKNPFAIVGATLAALFAVVMLFFMLINIRGITVYCGIALAAAIALLLSCIGYNKVKNTGKGSMATGVGLSLSIFTVLLSSISIIYSL